MEAVIGVVSTGFSSDSVTVEAGSPSTLDELPFISLSIDESFCPPNEISIKRPKIVNLRFGVRMERLRRGEDESKCRVGLAKKIKPFYSRSAKNVISFGALLDAHSYSMAWDEILSTSLVIRALSSIF